MPVGTRDILLIIRATDRATGVIARVSTALKALFTQGLGALSPQQLLAAGGALTAIGVGLTVVGAKAVGFFTDAAEAAKEYNRESALTLTQVDELGVTLDQIKDIGKNVAATIPAPFEQMQASLFDIFSSMEVGVKDAETLLTGFAKAAVAGQTDVQTAGRATISIMNAWGLGVEDLTRVLDVQFELVAEGVGTYEEFATAIGRAIPAFASGGQSIESLAAGMAFLTRNGQTADQAATALARAMDLLKRPDVIQALHDIGVEVLNADGSFRQLSEIMLDVNKAWGHLSDAEQIAKFKEIFGTSTAQARRFFELAIDGATDLDALFQQMLLSGGSMEEAFAIMAEQGASTAQLLTNNWQILKTEIGDVVLPVLLRLTEWALAAVRWFRDLDPAIQKAVIIFAALAAVGLVVLGVLTALAGAFLILKAVGIGVIASIAAIAVIFAAVVAAGYLVIRNWDTIKEVASDVWNAVSGYIDTAWQKMQQFWDWLSSTFVGIWHTIREVALGVWSAIVSGFDTAVSAAQSAVDGIVSAFRSFVDFFQAIGKIPLFQEFIATVQHVAGLVAKGFGEIGNAIQEFWEFSQPILRGFGAAFQVGFQQFQAVAKAIIGVFQIIVTFLRQKWDIIRSIIESGLRFAKRTIESFVNAVMILWENFGDNILNVITSVFNLIRGIIEGVLNIIRGIIRTVMAVIRGDWSTAWEGIKQVVDGVWQIITSIIGFFINGILNVIDTFFSALHAAWEIGWQFVKDLFTSAWDLIFNAIDTAVGGVINFFQELPGRLVDALGNLLETLPEKGKNLITGLWNGIWNAVQAVITWFKNLGASILEWIGDLVETLLSMGGRLISGFWKGIWEAVQFVITWFKELGEKVVEWVGDLSGVLFDAGAALIQGLIDGIKSMGGLAGSAASIIANNVSATIDDSFGIKSPSIVMFKKGQQVVQGLANGITSNLGLVTKAMNQLSMTANLGAFNVNGTGQTAGFGARSITIAPGAFNLHIEGVSDTERVQEVVHNELREFVRTLHTAQGPS